jgi:hypothetical protein
VTVETEGERKGPAPPPMFGPRITNMQRRTATIEQVVNRLNYILKIINNDKIKIMTTKLDYHKIILDIMTKKSVTHTPTSATTCLRSGNKKIYTNMCSKS